MADTIITIEIARAIKALLTTAVASVEGVTVYADGVADMLAEGETVPDGAEEDVSLPCVSVVVSESKPFAFGSKLREYPVTVEAATWHPNDKDQTTLYTIGNLVGEALNTTPTLSLSLHSFRALVVQSEGQRDTQGRLQLMMWTVNVKTQKP
jgi:hypothetical protein